MGSRFEQYRIKVGDDIGSPDYWNTPRLRDIDNRLNTLESQRTELNDVIEEGRVIFRERVEEVLTPLVQEVDEIAQVGVMLRARTHSDILISTGTKIMFIDETEKHRFAAPAYVSIMGNADPSRVLLGTVTSYDRSSGELVVEVQKVLGSGSFNDWVVTAAAASESETAAYDAINARNAAQGYRDEASTSANSAIASKNQASTSATQAVAANSQAQIAKAAAQTAKTDTVDAIAQWTSAVLAPQASDPSTRQGGAPLQPGDQYFRTTDAKWRTWDGSQWTINAIPLDSEAVTTVFGRGGVVEAQPGDYRSDQISRDSGQQAILAGANVEAALQALIALVTSNSGGKLDAADVSAFIHDVLFVAADAAAARTALGLTNMATMNPSAVALTGGTMSGVTFDDGTF